jgi:hypothetical protein
MEERAAGLSEGQREQLKLTATYLNGIATGILLIGGLSIPTTIVLTATVPELRFLAIGIGLFSVCLSPYIHWVARRMLGKLDR